MSRIRGPGRGRVAPGASATTPLPYVVEFETGSAAGVEGQTLRLTLRRRLADETANEAWRDVSVTTPAGQPGNLGLMLIPDPSGESQAILRLGPMPCIWKEGDVHPTDGRDELQFARACELTGLPSLETPVNQLWSETPSGRNPHWAMIAGVAETTEVGTRLSLFVNGVRVARQDLPATSLENRTGNCTSLVLGTNTLTCDGRTVNYELVGKRINAEQVWGLGGAGSAVDNVQVYREPLTPKQIQMVYDGRFPADTDDCGTPPPPA